MLPDRYSIIKNTLFFSGRKWKASEVGNCCTVCCIMLFGEIDLINFNFNATQCYAEMFSESFVLRTFTETIRLCFFPVFTHLTHYGRHIKVPEIVTN